MIPKIVQFLGSFLLRTIYQPKMKFKDYLTSIAIALVVIAYVVSPVDLVPDVVPAVGTVDDGIVVLIGLLREILRKPKD